MADEDTVKGGSAKPRKPRTVTAPIGAVVEATKSVGETVVASVVHATEGASAKIEAATSPAIDSDTITAPVETAAAAIQETTQMATFPPADATEKAQAVFGDMTGRFKAAVEKSTKLSEDLAEFTKGNVEAVIASARIAAQAGETLGQDAAAYGKKNLDSATAAFKSFATVKSPTELFQLQSEFVKAQFDSAVAEASKVSETLLKVAGEIAQPISNRYALAAEKFKASSL